MNKLNRSENTSSLARTLAVITAISALVLQRANADVLEITSWGSQGISAGSLYLQHISGASEGADGYDLPLPPEPPNFRGFEITTKPYGTELVIDARPFDSQSVFNGFLKVVDMTGLGLGSTNYLTFSFLQQDPNRTYWVDISEPSKGFSYSGIITDGMNVPLPPVYIFTIQDSGSDPGVDMIPPPGPIEYTYGTINVTPYTVPEPSTLELAIIGAAAAAFLSRERRERTVS